MTARIFGTDKTCRLQVVLEMGDMSLARARVVLGVAGFPALLNDYLLIAFPT